MNSHNLPDLPCYLNGEFSSIRDAKISVMDRGFIFGDGVYEVIPVYGGKPFRMAQHLARLSRSLKELRVDNPLTPEQWVDIAQQLVSKYAQNVGGNPSELAQLVYIQVTRGVAVRDHVMTQGGSPTVFVMSNAMKLPSAEQRAQGVTCVTASDFRWEKAHIKSVSLLGAVFARQISADVGALETIMFRNDYLSEAAASNVWIVKGGKLIGVPKDNLVLEGIRFGLMEELCQSLNIAFELRRVTREEVLNADELLLSSATKEILPVTRLDGKPVADGKPGPVYARLYSAYQNAKAAA